MANSSTMTAHIRRTSTSTCIIMRLALLAFVLISCGLSKAFQPQLQSSSLHRNYRHQTSTVNAHNTKLCAKKPAKRSKSKSGVQPKAGGFGTKKSNNIASAPADPTKVRSVSGYTGSGTKVLASAANNFDRIRKLFGQAATTDVYVRSPLNDESTFWFVGKVIRMIDDEGSVKDGSSNAEDNVLVGSVYPTENEALISQKRLILEYAKNQLRPQNMGGPYSKNLELWSAPGDSEMDVVQNKVTLIPITQSSKDLRDGFNVNDVGYNPEIYVGDEKEKGGLRVVRDGEGKPVKPVFEISG